MNWIHKIASSISPDKKEMKDYLLEMADLLNDTTFVKNVDHKKGLGLLCRSVYCCAWNGRNGEIQDWAEYEKNTKDLYIIMLESYADSLEQGIKSHRPVRPPMSLLNETVSPTEAGKTASVKTLRVVANDMKNIFGFINTEWLAQLMSAATGNIYTRDRIRKRIGDMK